MEEDVTGTREEAVGDRYTFCTRCGKAVLKSAAHRAPPDLNRQEIHSAEQTLCDECCEELTWRDEYPPRRRAG